MATEFSTLILAFLWELVKSVVLHNCMPCMTIVCVYVHVYLSLGVQKSLLSSTSTTDVQSSSTDQQHHSTSSSK